MSELETFLTDVADAIREKKGTTEAIPAQSFANEIRTIEGGGNIDLQPLTFTGAVEATYDGKTPVTVEIPQGGETPRIEMTSDDTAVTLEANKYYVFPEMASLDITLGGAINPNIVQEYKFRFTSGATATNLILPNTLNGTIEVSANSVVEVSIIDGCLVSHSWEV